MKAPRLSIRYKMLLVVSLTLVVAMSAYLYLAVTMFRQDKLTDVFDLTAALSGTLAEEVGAQLELLGDKLVLQGQAAWQPDVDEARREEILDAFLRNEPDLVTIALFEKIEGNFEQIAMRANPEALEDQSVTLSDLAQSDARDPVPLDQLEEIGLQVRNASLPPDAALFRVAVAVPGKGSKRAAVATLRANRLLQIVGRSKQYVTYLVDSEGQTLIHPDLEKMVNRVGLSEKPIVNAAVFGPIVRGVKEFDDPEQGTLLGAYARVPVGGAAVISEIPKDVALQATRKFVRNSALFAIAIVLMAFIVSIVFSRRITMPLMRLQQASQSIGRGKFDTVIDVETNDEIGDLATTMTEMLVALKDVEAQLVQSEKMAAFGELGAGFAHELRNPITGVIGNAKLAQQFLGKANEAKLSELLSRIEKAAIQCADVVTNFLKFARSEAVVTAEMDVNQVVKDGLALVEHQLQISNVKIQTSYTDDLPPVTGNTTHVQQVLMNLCINAQQAMKDGGTLTVRTGVDKQGDVFVIVADTGPGIPASHRKKVFEPFYTTKPAGEGTGLGLAICYRLIRDMGGMIAVGDAPRGGGALFRIRLPAVKSAGQTEAAVAQSSTPA